MPPPCVDFGPVQYGCTKYKRRMVLFASVCHPGKRFEFCYSSSYKDKRGLETAYYKCVGCMHVKRFNDGRRIPKIAVRQGRLVNSNPDRPSNFPHFCVPIDLHVSDRRQREREERGDNILQTDGGNSGEEGGPQSVAGSAIAAPQPASGPSPSRPPFSVWPRHQPSPVAVHHLPLLLAVGKGALTAADSALPAALCPDIASALPPPPLVPLLDSVAAMQQIQQQLAAAANFVPSPATTQSTVWGSGHSGSNSSSCRATWA